MKGLILVLLMALATSESGMGNNEGGGDHASLTGMTPIVRPVTPISRPIPPPTVGYPRIPPITRNPPMPVPKPPGYYPRIPPVGYPNRPIDFRGPFASYPPNGVPPRGYPMPGFTTTIKPPKPQRWSSGYGYHSPTFPLIIPIPFMFPFPSYDFDFDSVYKTVIMNGTRYFAPELSPYYGDKSKRAFIQPCPKLQMVTVFQSRNGPVHGLQVLSTITGQSIVLGTRGGIETSLFGPEFTRLYVSANNTDGGWVSFIDGKEIPQSNSVEVQSILAFSMISTVFGSQAALTMLDIHVKGNNKFVYGDTDEVPFEMICPEDKKATGIKIGTESHEGSVNLIRSIELQCEKGMPMKASHGPLGSTFKEISNAQGFNEALAGSNSISVYVLGFKNDRGIMEISGTTGRADEYTSVKKLTGMNGIFSKRFGLVQVRFRFGGINNGMSSTLL